MVLLFYITCNGNSVLFFFKQIYYNSGYAKEDNINNSTLAMVAVLAAVAMLSAAVIVPIQQASAQDTNFSFKQRQYNGCSFAAECSNAGIIISSPF